MTSWISLWPSIFGMAGASRRAGFSGRGELLLAERLLARDEEHHVVSHQDEHRGRYRRPLVADIQVATSSRICSFVGAHVRPSVVARFSALLAAGPS